VLSLIPYHAMIQIEIDSITGKAKGRAGRTCGKSDTKVKFGYDWHAETGTTRHAERFSMFLEL
jgi:hypothetical protein